MRAIFSACPRCSPELQGGWRWWAGVWLPAFLAMCVIAVESTTTFSSQNTSSWLRPIFERIVGHMSDARWELLHHYLRKTGHFIGYGGVGYTFLRAWLHTRARAGIANLRVWRTECTALAILCTAMVASLDEFHQSFLPGRTGVPADVVLDTCGACVLSLVVWLFFWRARGAEPAPAKV